jgi:lysophospholipase
MLYNGSREILMEQSKSTHSFPYLTHFHFAMDRSNRWLHLVTFVSSITLPALARSAASDAYTPIPASCPATLVRSASSGPSYLSPQEVEYISGRQSVLPGAWSTYLANVNAHASAHDVHLPDYVQQLLGGKQVADGMTLGVAVSGGGYRAAITGGGILNALDARNSTSAQAGTGGLLQGASYISGLSGGSWLISGLTEANFPPIHDFMFGTSSDSSAGESSNYGGILSQYGYIDASSNPIIAGQYISTVVTETSGKQAAGFPVTFTDVWARSVSRHWVNGTTSSNFFNTDVKHGAGQLWSNAVNT